LLDFLGNLFNFKKEQPTELPCPNCGEKITLNAEYCKNCGLNTSFFMRKCYKCGEFNDLAASTCFKCSQHFNSRAIKKEEIVFRCPICGHRSESFFVICPICGARSV